MIPVSLRLRNFMSYGEAVPPLDFSQLNTACLTGDNGHGKSTLLDAITWSLWGQTRAKNVDDIVRLGQEEAEVEFVFDLEGAQYRVIRKRSLRTKTGHSSLELQGFDPLTHQFRSISGNSIRETETKIVQLLHMNYDTFINSVFVLQGRADEFTTRRPGERKRILAEILGLAVFDELEARAREYRGTLDHEVKTLQQRLAELRHEVARKDELAAAVSAHQGTLLQLQTDIQIEQQRLEQLRQEQNALGLQSQRAQEAERRLQDVQRAYADIDRQLALHQRQAAAYEAVLQQEAAIQAGYASLQHLKEEEQRENAKAEVYTSLQQRQSELQQAITAAQHHLELERSSAQQRLQDTHSALQACDTILQEAPQITANYDALQLAQEHEAAMAQRLQRRYTLEQEKTQVERRIQQKRHALELEQRTLVARQQEWQQKESHLPAWQQQMGTVRQQLAQMEQQAKRFDQVRTEGVELKVRIETSLPQTLQTLQQEIDQQHEKRQLLAAAGAHCPLCERTLSEADRRRVLQNLADHISGYETRMHRLQGELRQLEQQRRQLRTEYKTLEQHLEQRQALEQQYATLQVSLDEARRARENLVALAETLQMLDGQLAAGTYAAEDLDHLQKLTAELDSLAYDQQEHEAVKQQLVALTSAALDWQRLQQAIVDQTHLSERQKTLQQNVAVLQQTLAKQQFVVTEQHELGDVVARMAHLNFNPATYNLLRQRLQEHQHFERQHIELETARQQLTETRALLQDLEARKQHYETELRSIAAERQQLLQGLEALEQLRTDRARTEALLQNLQHREGEARLALGRSQSYYEHCLQREAELQEKTQQHGHTVEERTLYGDLVNLFGKNGIQALIIENAIPELADEANRILSRISDNAMHLTLETQRDTRAGGVVETLDIKISDTLGTRNYELFSGGEAFRINFALRIALSKMLARRAGARLRTLVIDEGFGTQDTQGLERLVEIIKAIRVDFDKIIIITHLRELKNAFDTYIEVKKDPLQGSSYQVF